jgi:multicomponent Na+:H+ antiporter subunit B
MIDFILLFFLVVCAIAAVRMKDLLSAIMILGAYSLIMAVVWTRMNAVDVAFTEASVGAGITSVLLLAALSRTQRSEADRRKGLTDKRQVPAERRRMAEYAPQPKKSGISFHSVLALIVVVMTGAVLVYSTIDMPDYGAPVNLQVASKYIENSYRDTGAVNFVTAVLASYRGYDTLGETTVIFTAGICVILLLRRKRTQ